MKKNRYLNKIPIKTNSFWYKTDSGIVIIGLHPDYILNRTSSIIWKFIDNETNISEIVNRIHVYLNCKEDKLMIEQKVINCLKEFKKVKLVNLKEEVEF